MRIAVDSTRRPRMHASTRPSKMDRSARASTDSQRSMNELAGSPAIGVFERHLRAVQITAGALMFVSAAIVLIAYNDTRVRVTAGVLIALAGSAMLVPALFPALRRKYPRVFGAPYLAQKPPP
jgi:hypothetical protein